MIGIRDKIFKKPTYGKIVDVSSHYLLGLEGIDARIHHSVDIKICDCLNPLWRVIEYMNITSTHLVCPDASLDDLDLT